ncbi:small oligopeptide transporter [Tilletiaria anomala UBC 951]|uniref:Small oligopeptide transporter n=1 Tax=Tilletiaria anomala (strain ATCC 24038 / CBS 436.72 / UBC 951) TaxID=1037660 RepID=A0A066WJJ0_TILAU|nr:small oligopeptide transporter [Tilletiaria anomala UBC 951]KDN52723.1 small oligopeptide transporter [Tilletiaria anomala UBC 951]
MVNDPNLYPELIETAQAALEKHDPTAELDFEGVLEEDSIYPEVRAAVTNIDDPSMPVNKLGAWFLGIVSTILISGINQFFIFQSPLTSITCIIAQLVAFPLGKALALIPYKAEWPLGWFINPGPFNIKEHTLITVMATVAYGQAYATEILTVQKVYYHQEIPAGYQILLRLSTQLTGFSYAGFIRQWLEAAEGSKWSRNHMFVTVFLAILCWEFVPVYLFTSLTYFSWPTWITSENYGINMVFGGTGGIGLNMISLDWSTLGYLGSPLWNPFNSTHVLGANGELEEAAYETYSVPYLPSSFMVSLVHVSLFYGKGTVKQFRRTIGDEPDIHARLMSRYKEAPVWWYTATFLVSFDMAVPAVCSYSTSLPVLALIIALILAAIYTLLLAIISVITGSTIGLNVITEIIIGYMLPGHLAAMMIFKCFDYITMVQAVTFLSDLMFGHYMKVPPRTMFAGQMIAEILSVFVQLGVMAWIFQNVPGLCTADAHPSRFTCSYARTFYTASILWGLIGPRHAFDEGARYQYTNIMFAIGAFLPIPIYFLARKFLKSFVCFINWPIIFSGPGYFPPASAPSYTAWATVGFFFQYFLRKKPRFCNSGTAISVIIITPALQYPRAPALDNVFYTETGIPWWGNNIEANTLHGQGLVRYPVPDQGFAPAPDGQWDPSPSARSA